ncbi:MAG: sulfite exporter TauE/SafE family protein [Acidobacteria bacterium]|nr:sulfite exporter TauE/SafE family protein [Acidobacteriota bacterium]
MHATIIFILLIVFVATVIRSAFGFGEALIAVPLLAFFLPMRIAAPLAVLVSITIAAVVVVQDWRHIHLRSAGWLVFSTIFGIPVGLLLLTHAPERAIRAGLGVLILLFALFTLRGGVGAKLHKDSKVWMAVCGFIAGVLGGAYGMNGPPLVIYGSLRGWTAQQFRATLQAYFLPASILGMAGYVSAGMWTRDVTRDFLFCLPVLLPAILLGRAINHRLSASAFSRYIYGGLALIGLALIIQSIVHFS